MHSPTAASFSEVYNNLWFGFFPTSLSVHGINIEVVVLVYTLSLMAWRTPEVGLRRAVEAKSKRNVVQLLSARVAIPFSGGLFGLRYREYH